MAESMKTLNLDAVAREIKKAQCDPFPYIGQTHDDFQSKLSAMLQAVQLAKYIAQYYPVNRVSFLNKCMVKP